MIKVTEIPYNAPRYVEEGHGNGLSVGALATAIPAGVISLANFAKEWLGGRNMPVNADSISCICNALAPAIGAVSGRMIGPNTILSEKEAEIAMLKAEKYTDAQVAKLFEANTAAMKEQFAYTLQIEKQQAQTEAEVKCLNQKLETYELSQREKEALKDQLIDCKIEKVLNKTECLAAKVNDGFAMTNQGFANFDARLNAITEVVIPSSVVCKRKNCCNEECNR